MENYSALETLDRANMARNAASEQIAALLAEHENHVTRPGVDCRLCAAEAI